MNNCGSPDICPPMFAVIVIDKTAPFCARGQIEGIEDADIQETLSWVAVSIRAGASSPRILSPTSRAA